MRTTLSSEFINAKGKESLTWIATSRWVFSGISVVIISALPLHCSRFGTMPELPREKGCKILTDI